MKVTIELDGVDLVKAWAARSELTREVQLRCRVYPRWIAEKKMTQADADLRMAALGNSLVIVNAVVAGLEAAGKAAETNGVPEFALGKVTDADREMRPQCRFCKSFGIEGKRPDGSPSGLFLCPQAACHGGLAAVSRELFEGSQA